MLTSVKVKHHLLSASMLGRVVYRIDGGQTEVTYSVVNLTIARPAAPLMCLSTQALQFIKPPRSV